MEAARGADFSTEPRLSCWLQTWHCGLLERKLNLCGILWKRLCPRSWNMLSQACVMWLHPALPSSAPSLLVSGDFMWEKDKPRTPSPLILRCFRLILHPPPLRLSFVFRGLVLFCCFSSTGLCGPAKRSEYDKRFFLGCWTLILLLSFFTRMPKRWMRRTVWTSPLAVVRIKRKVLPFLDVLSLPGATLGGCNDAIQPCAAQVSTSKCRREYGWTMVMSPTWGFWQKRTAREEGAWAKRARTTRNGTPSGSLCCKTCSFISRTSPALDPRDCTCWRDAYATGRLRRSPHSQPRSVWKSRYGERARKHTHTRGERLTHSPRRCFGVFQASCWNIDEVQHCTGNVRLRRKTPLNSILVVNKALSFGAHRLFFFSLSRNDDLESGAAQTLADCCIARYVIHTWH